MPKTSLTAFLSALAPSSTTSTPCGPPVSMDLFALATLPTAADEAGGPPSMKFYELRDNLRLRRQVPQGGRQARPRLEAADGLLHIPRRALAPPADHEPDRVELRDRQAA